MQQQRSDKSLKFGWKEMAKGMAFGPAWPLYMKKFGQRMEEVEAEARRWHARAEELAGAQETLTIAEEQLRLAAREREDAEEARWQAREDQLQADRDRAAAQERVREAEDVEKTTAGERRRLDEELSRAQGAERRARNAGVWVTRQRVGLLEQLGALRGREREVRKLLREVRDQRASIRGEEEKLEMKRLGIFPSVTLTESDLAAARPIVGYVSGARNICVAGAAGSGKSSLINALRGLREGDPDAAPITHVGTWAEHLRDPVVIREVYLDDARPFVVYHEVTLGRTGWSPLSAWEYYVGEKLWAYDELVLVHETPAELDTRVQQIAKMRGQKCTVVRTKADLHVHNFHYLAAETGAPGHAAATAAADGVPTADGESPVIAPPSAGESESAPSLRARARALYMEEVRREERQRWVRASMLENLRPDETTEAVVSARQVWLLVREQQQQQQKLQLQQLQKAGEEEEDVKDEGVRNDEAVLLERLELNVLPINGVGDQAAPAKSAAPAGACGDEAEEAAVASDEVGGHDAMDTEEDREMTPV